jgi:hypothetical protein
MSIFSALHRSKLQKFFGMPVPKSLPLRDFCEPGEYTWETWREDMEKYYPIRYFLLDRLPHYFVVHVKMPIDDFIYKIKSHTIKKQHLIDIRNYEYDYGYCDPDHQILYANFAILSKHVKENKIAEYLESSKKDIEKAKNMKLTPGNLECDVEFHQRWADKYQVMLDLNHWWLSTRPYKQEQIEEALRLASEIPERGIEKYKTLHELENNLLQEENEMLKKLIDVRSAMWN